MALDIQDKFAIEELLRRACYNADYNPPESMRAIYTSDAVFEVPAMDISCQGIDNIIAFFTQSRAGFSSARHIINNVVVEGDGDSAKSSAYLQVLRTDGGATAIVSVARYLDTLKRTADGWRLAHRSVAMG
jgi:ketosteroid isomerase-like protein